MNQWNRQEGGAGFPFPPPPPYPAHATGVTILGWNIANSNIDYTVPTLGNRHTGRQGSLGITVKSQR